MSRINPDFFYSKLTDEWPTPKALFESLNKEFGFTLDPCATSENAKCKKYFTRADNGLMQDWSGETVFMNPPYGTQIKQWISKAFSSSLSGATVVSLLPARTDTEWFHRYCMRGEIRFLRGRLVFGEAKNTAPFPSIVVVFRPFEFKLISCPPPANF